MILAEDRRESSSAWRILAPAGTIAYEVPSSREQRAHLVASLNRLRPGTPIALFDSGLRAKHRCAGIARKGRIALGRAYLVLPSAEVPLYFAEDADESARYLWTNILATPPAPPITSALASIALHISRLLIKSPAVRGAIPRRVVLGRKL